jgi:hypothetical protein
MSTIAGICNAVWPNQQKLLQISENKLNLKFKKLQFPMKWEAKAIIHHKEQRIAVWFENNPSVNARFNFNAMKGLNRVT